MSTACKGTMVANMEDRVLLVTGANSGIGKATALGLARLGGTVVMACRSATRGEAARQDIVRDSGNSKVYLEIVDLASEDSTRSFAEEFKRKYPRLRSEEHTSELQSRGQLVCRLLLEKK